MCGTEKMTETLSYQVCHAIGTLIGKLINFTIRLFWAGTVKAMMIYKPLIIVYVILAIANLISYQCFNTYEVTLIITVVVALVMGCVVFSKEYPTKQKQKYFLEIFKSIGLQSTDEKIPCFVFEKDISEFARLIAFNTTVPLAEWLKRKEQIEMKMNVEIIEITQDKQDKRNINLIIETHSLPEVIDWCDDFLSIVNILNIGVSYTGVVGMNLEKYPHGFVAGETGSGKSNILKCLIHQSLLKNYEVVLIDFKRGVSFASFSDYVTIYYEYKTVMETLKRMVEETNNRLDKFRETRVDNINEYNKKCSDDYMQRIVIFIDELAELLKTRDKETSNILNDCIETLTRLSRAVGIHLIMGIQRPDSTVISGQIKNNVSYRICGRFVDPEPSRIMLGDDLASTLLNIKGRFIVKDDNFHEVQCFYFTDNEAVYKKINNTEVHHAVKNDEVIQEAAESRQQLQRKRKKESQVQQEKIVFDFNDISND